MLDMPLSDFLTSRLLQRQARLAMCTPAELLASHLREDTDLQDSEELGLALAEACEAATDFSVSHVVLDPADLHFAGTRLVGLVVSGSSGPMAA
jgi:hypothetical protein